MRFGNYTFHLIDHSVNDRLFNTLASITRSYCLFSTDEKYQM